MLYSTVSGPQDCSKHFYTLLPWQTCSIKPPSQLLWEASSHKLQLMREGCPYTYPPLSTARYSVIQLIELEQCRVNKLAQCFKIAAQDSNPGSLSGKSEALPLSYCALRLHRSNVKGMLTPRDFPNMNRYCLHPIKSTNKQQSLHTKNKKTTKSPACLAPAESKKVSDKH